MLAEVEGPSWAGFSFSASKHQIPKTQPCSGIHIFRSEGELGLQPSSQKKPKGELAALGVAGGEPTGYLLLCMLGRTAPAWDPDSGVWYAQPAAATAS